MVSPHTVRSSKWILSVQNVADNKLALAIQPQTSDVLAIATQGTIRITLPEKDLRITFEDELCFLPSQSEFAGGLQRNRSVGVSDAPRRQFPKKCWRMC